MQTRIKYRFLVLLAFALLLLLLFEHKTILKQTPSTTFHYVSSRTKLLPKYGNTVPHYVDNFTPSMMELNPKMKTYELGGRPIIWQYWHTDEMPLYVKLLIEAMQCRNPEFLVMTVHDSTLYQFLPDFKISRRVFDTLIPQHRADLFRIAILIEYGGVYADVDTFVLDKLYPVYQLLSKYDVVTPNWGDEKFAMGALGPTRAGLKVFKMWHQNQLKTIEESIPRQDKQTKIKIYPFKWASLLLHATEGLEKELINNRTTYRALNGLATVGQLVMQNLQEKWSVPFDDYSHLFLPLNWSPFLFLHNSKMQTQFLQFTKISELIQSKNPTIFSAFVGCALLDCKQKFETMTKEAGSRALLTEINAVELIESLKQMDSSVCAELNLPRPFNFDTDLVS